MTKPYCTGKDKYAPTECMFFQGDLSTRKHCFFGSINSKEGGYLLQNH